MLELLISFCIASAGMAISPGPDNVYVLTQSITNGTSYGIATTAGLITGCIVHTTLVAFGISAILMASEIAFFVIKIAGALYLIYLAYKVYKELERILKINHINMSVDKVIDIAKTITTIKINLPISGNTMTQTMLLTQRHKSIAHLFDDNFWENF